MENLLNGGIQEGFNAGSAQELEELNKALGTGTQGDAYGNYDGDMTAIRPQSLEGTLKVVTAKQNQIKFWKSIGKKQAYNTVEEFNVLDSYGGNSSPFFTEGGLPNEEDSNFVRQSQMVKFLGTTRVVTHPATLVRNTVGDMVAMQQQQGTIWLLQQLERSLYFADSSLDPLAFDGLIKQVTNFVSGKSYQNQHIIDMRGQNVDENIMEDMATILADNYGSGNYEMHLTNQVHKDFSKNLFAQRRIMGMNGQENTLGAPVRKYVANTGDINFVNNVFLKPQNVPLASAQKGAPATPTVGATPATAVADTASLMSAQTYYYFVSAKNSAGESTAVSIGSIAVASGQRVDIVINRVTSDPVAKSYKLFRGATSDVTKALLVNETADAGTGTTQTLSDKNFDIPGTHTAILIDNDPEEVLTFKQLAPLMKLPLARISASERFMILLYGMVQVYNPRRVIVIKNIGLLGTNSNRPLFGPTYDQPNNGTLRPISY